VGFWELSTPQTGCKPVAALTEALALSCLLGGRRPLSGRAAALVWAFLGPVRRYYAAA